MERSEAVCKLKKLIGKDLVSLARQYEVPIWKGNKKNKGWAVRTFVHILDSSYRLYKPPQGSNKSYLKGKGEVTKCLKKAAT